jgi:hypothetical protein
MINDGFSFLMRKPTLIQFKGLIELMATSMDKLDGAGSELYWVVPGNKKPGYCKENVLIRVGIPSAIKTVANFSSKAARLPLKGQAGPIMIN